MKKKLAYIFQIILLMMFCLTCINSVRDKDIAIASDSIPPVPTAITATVDASGENIVVSWNESEGATSYKIYRSDYSRSEKVLIGSTGNTSFTYSSAPCGLYLYWVTASNSAGTSDYSRTDVRHYKTNGCPAQRPYISATNDYRDSIHIYIRGYPEDQFYEIYRGTEYGKPSAMTKLATIAATTVNDTYPNTTYIDTSAPCDEKRIYWAKAINAFATSKFSAPDTGYRGACEAPPAPERLWATDGLYNDKIRISWSPQKGFFDSTYEVYRSTTPVSQGGVMENVQITSDTVWYDTVASPLEIYYYAVKATNIYGSSPFSVLDAGFYFNKPDSDIETKLTQVNGQKDDYFGTSVAMQDDIAVIGASGDDENGFRSGAAYVFEHDSDDKWSQTYKLTASDAEVYDYFGNVVAISDYTILIAADSNPDPKKEIGEGSVYVFEMQADGSWLQTQKLIPPALGEAERAVKFGYALAMNDNLLVVGAPRAFNDGERSGAAYIFERKENGLWWYFIQKIFASGGEYNDNFGEAVAVFDDLTLIGASGNDDNGTDAGAVYVFEKTKAGQWIQMQKLAASDAAINFGLSLALNSNVAAVGALDDDSVGSVYVFEQDTIGTWNQSAKLTADDCETDDFFGSSLALADDYLVIGADGDDYYGPFCGSAYLFFHQQDNQSWPQLSKIRPSDGFGNSHFGCSVAISNGYILAGAYGGNGTVDYTGAAYLYHVNSGIPSAPTGVNASDGEYPDMIRISWNASPAAMGYDVYRSTKLFNDGGAPTKIGTTTGLYLEDTTAVSGLIYYYWVKAKNKVYGNSKYSAFDDGYYE